MDKLLNSLYRKDAPTLGTEATAGDRLKQNGIAIDYSDIGITPYGIDAQSLGARQSPRTMAISQDMKIERTPYLNPTSISKGIISSRLGGFTEFRDTTGGTILLTYDPNTGTITIAGGILVNQTINVGTLYNSVMTGTITNLGTVNGGGYNAPFLTNAVTLQGVMTGGTYNGNFIGNVSGANIQNTSIIGGTINTTKLTGTNTISVNAGSNALSTSGNFEFQTYGSAIALAINYNGTTFLLTPSGTI